MLFFRKLLKLPGPKELGKSDCNALPSRDFSPDCEGYTWEDWHAEVKEKYPIRYFFAETASDFVKYKIYYPIYRPISEMKCYLMSHLIPNRKYHMLDLRQPKGSVEEYRYGWRDIPEKMLYAIFNLLDQFVKEELPHYYCPTDEEIEKAEEDSLNWSKKSLVSQKDLYFEVLAIHKWWVHDKELESKALDDLRTKWSRSRRTKDPKTKDYWNELLIMEDEFERKTDEMIARLMKIRRSLWT